MILSDIANFVGGKIGLTDAASLTKIKSWAQQRYALICADALWKDLLAVYTKGVAAAAESVVLPGHVSDLVECKFDLTGIVPIDQIFLFRSYPELWSNQGTPSHWSELPPTAVYTQPAASDTLRIKSSSAADVGNAVQIHGENANGETKSETIVLNGITGVLSVNTYAVIHGLSKGATIGTVTVKDNADILLFQTLQPAETQKLHRRLRLHTLPNTLVTLLILAKRFPGPFTADTAATQLPAKCDQALLALVHGDALEWQRQYGKAQLKFQEGLALLQSAKKDETYQAANSKRLTPSESVAEGCSPYDFV